MASWSVSAALWQVKNGEPGTRTRDAAMFLERIVSSDCEMARNIAMDLLLYVPVMRAADRR